MAYAKVLAGIMLAGLLLVANMAAAQNGSTGRYRLVPGDSVRINYVGAEEPITAAVDVDGQVRLADVGAVDVQGLNLDEAESRIEEEIAKAGIFVDPSVSLTIAAYAAVVVTGDVTDPGRFDYAPGMTVATALGLSGGTQANGVSRYEIERARAETSAQVSIVNLEIARTVVRIARLKALLADRETIELQEALRSAIPSPDAVDLDRMLAAETRILENDRARVKELVAFWEQEIETVEEQRRLFKQRIAVQEAAAARVADDLENVRKLQERGLQTASRVSNAELRAADAETRVLELETAQISAARSIANAQREQTQFTRNRREAALSDLNEAQNVLAEAHLRYKRVMDQLALLSGGNMGSVMSSEIIGIDYVIRSPRANRTEGLELTPETPLLPGDTLIVRVQLSAISDG